MKMPVSKERAKCIRKFLYYFRGGFGGEKYTSWERDYKWAAHVKWKENLYKKEYLRLLALKDYAEIARRATWLESGTNQYSLIRVVVKRSWQIPVFRISP